MAEKTAQFVKSSIMGHQVQSAEQQVYCQLLMQCDWLMQVLYCLFSQYDFFSFFIHNFYNFEHINKSTPGAQFQLWIYMYVKFQCRSLYND